MTNDFKEYGICRCNGQHEKCERIAALKAENERISRFKNELTHENARLREALEKAERELSHARLGKSGTE